MRGYVCIREKHREACASYLCGEHGARHSFTVPVPCTYSNRACRLRLHTRLTNESRLRRVLIQCITTNLLLSQYLESVDVDFRDGVFERVEVLPGAGAQLALDEQARALADILLGNLGRGIEHHDIMPLGAFWNLHARGRAPSAFRGGERKRGHRPCIDISYLGIAPDIAHKYYFIHWSWEVGKLGGWEVW